LRVVVGDQVLALVVDLVAVVVLVVCVLAPV
jgi:hypothetical protein